MEVDAKHVAQAPSQEVHDMLLAATSAASRAASNTTGELSGELLGSTLAPGGPSPPNVSD